MFARLAILTLLADGCGVRPAPVPTPLERPLPRVALQALDGRLQPLPELLGGRAALVSLWAPWCESCVAELPSLMRLAERAKANGGAVVSVAVGESTRPVAEFLAAQGAARTAIYQFVDERFRFADALGEKRVPTTLVVDRRGRVVFAGAALDERALAALRTVLQ